MIGSGFGGLAAAIRLQVPDIKPSCTRQETSQVEHMFTMTTAIRSMQDRL